MRFSDRHLLRCCVCVEKNLVKNQNLLSNNQLELCSYFFNIDSISVNQGCFEEDTDYPGHDLDHVISENPQKCQLACQELENCHFWTYVESGSKCYRKSIKKNVNQHGSATSGPKYCDSSELENLRDPNIYYFFDRKSLSGHTQSFFI